MPKISYGQRIPHRFGFSIQDIVSLAEQEPEIALVKSLSQATHIRRCDTDTHTAFEMVFELTDADLTWVALQYPTTELRVWLEPDTQNSGAK